MAEKEKEYQIKILRGNDEVVALKLLSEPLREFWGWLCSTLSKKVDEKKDLTDK